MASPLLLAIKSPTMLPVSPETASIHDIAAHWRPAEATDALWELTRINHADLSRLEARSLRKDPLVCRLIADRTDQGKQREPLYLERDGATILIDKHNRVRLVASRLIAENIVTDTGATAMLKNTWNNAGSAVGIFNQIAIDTNAGSTTLTSALAANTSGVTSISVAATPASIASGTTLTLGYGTGNTQNIVTSALANAGATSITVTSFTVNATGFSIGANVVPNPTTSDNPSSLGGTSAYSGALSSGAFTFSGTGAGNRQVSIQFTFSTSTTAGSYTEAWTVNTNPVAATGETASHLIFPVQTINSSTSLQITIVEKV